MKNNNFAEEYRTYKEIEARFDAARDAKDGAKVAEARKEMHELVESIEAKGKDYESLFESYKDAWNRGNAYIDINNCIWDEKVAPLIENLRNFGIDHFTFSSTWSSAVQIAWLFTENGCSLEGLEKINGIDPEDKIPAYIFSIR
ncbi:MAG: hypothetical protein LUD72_06780 [Bacteroidales bacterium]|nr:hypothetical protein [Bacteroidales bacterium]